MQAGGEAFSGGLAQPTQEVGCVERHCVPFGVDQTVVLLALFVDFQWSGKISWRMGLLEEQDGAVVGVFLSLTSGPASGVYYFRL